MTFTRQSDDATLTPILVVAPSEQSRETPTVARRVAQSNAVRVTYVGAPAPRRGTLTLLFATYLEVNAAASFFSEPSLFEWDGAENAPRDYVIVNYRIFEQADSGSGDFAMQFAVSGGDITLRGTETTGWELDLPYLEVPA